VARAEISATKPILGVRFLQHTADVGIEVEAESLDECLARAAAALFAMMFVPPERTEPGSEKVVEVSVEAEDPEALLVAWLQELLYMSEVEHLLFLWFEVETDGRRLKGRAGGRPISPEIEPAGPLVKGVTQHGLRVGRDGDRWIARVIVDV
jgi:SHS2 domain-containing protein